MFLVRFCCASSRHGNDESMTSMKHCIDANSNDLVEKKLRKMTNVLTEFMHFERGLGIQNVDVIKII